MQQYQLAAGVLLYINYKGTAELFPVNGNFVDFDVLLLFLSVLWIRIGFSADPVIPHLALLDLEPDSYSQMRIRIQPTKMNTDQCGSRSVSRSGSTVLVSLLTAILYLFAFPAAI